MAKSSGKSAKKSGNTEKSGLDTGKKIKTTSNQSKDSANKKSTSKQKKTGTSKKSSTKQNEFICEFCQKPMKTLNTLKIHERNCKIKKNQDKKKDFEARLDPQERQVFNSFLRRMVELGVVERDKEQGTSAYKFTNDLYRIYLWLQSKKTIPTTS